MLAIQKDVKIKRKFIRSRCCSSPTRCTEISTGGARSFPVSQDILVENSLPSIRSRVENVFPPAFVRTPVTSGDTGNGTQFSYRSLFLCLYLTL